MLLDSNVLKTGGGAQSRTARVGVEGQKVLDDIKGVVREVKAWGEAKNNDDLLQNFFASAHPIHTS